MPMAQLIITAVTVEGGPRARSLLAAPPEPSPPSAGLSFRDPYVRRRVRLQQLDPAAGLER
jgi:hypothetical protein